MLNLEMTMGEAIRSVVDARPDQEVLVSGSTRLTNRELLRRIEALTNGLAGIGVQKGDKLVLLLPPGPEFVYLFFALASLGAAVVPLNPEIHERGLREVLEDARPVALVTSRVAVPTAYQVMLKLPDLDHYDTSSLLVCATGTAPCPPALGRELQRRFGCAVYIGFGMTEAAGGIAVSSLADSDDQQVETVGRPMPGVDIRIVDDQRHDLPQGEVGELAIRSDGVMQGYYQAPELTAEVIDEAGWYYTGDLVRLDEEGYLRVVGRKKDLIIRGGQNIYPAEIESYLVTHPKVNEAAVVGVPATVGGERVWAFIRLKEGAEMSVGEVLDYCREALEPYKIPSQVRFVSQFPEAETGKPQKFQLRAMAMKELTGT